MHQKGPLQATQAHCLVAQLQTIRPTGVLVARHKRGGIGDMRESAGKAILMRGTPQAPPAPPFPLPSPAKQASVLEGLIPHQGLSDFFLFVPSS